MQLHRNLLQHLLQLLLQSLLQRLYISNAQVVFTRIMVQVDVFRLVAQAAVILCQKLLQALHNIHVLNKRDTGSAEHHL